MGFERRVFTLLRLIKYIGVVMESQMFAYSS